VAATDGEIQARRTAEVSFGKDAQEAIIRVTSSGVTLGTCLVMRKCHSSSVNWIFGLKRPSNSCDHTSAIRRRAQQRMRSYQRSSQGLEEHILEFVMWVVPDPFSPQDDSGSFTMASSFVATNTNHLLCLSGLFAIRVKDDGYLPERTATA
jgi:hypothetical protein